MHNDLEQPYTKEELIDSLRRRQQDVERFFTDIPDDRFFAGSNESWSPAENLEHLIKSVQPVAQALRLPKYLLRLVFGAAQTPSRTYATVREDYLNKLAAGAQASGRYIPKQPKPALDQEAVKTRLLSSWRGAGQELTAGLASWRENELDTYLLPHPFLGKLTVREMLFFTLYHNSHHAKSLD